MGTVASKVVSIFGFGEDPFDEGHVESFPPDPGVDIPGQNPLDEKCLCSVPVKGVKSLHEEDVEFLRNVDDYSVQSIVKHKGDATTAFDRGFSGLLAANKNLDKAMETMKAAYSKLAIKRRMLEHAQVSANYVNLSQCARFRKKFGLHLPCEDTYMETMKLYRNLQQRPTCAVGASLPLKPAGVLLGTRSVTELTGSAAAVAAKAARAGAVRGLVARRTVGHETGAPGPRLGDRFL